VALKLRYPASESLTGTYYIPQEVAKECQDMSWGSFKPLITDALIDHLHPIQVSTSYHLSIYIILVISGEYSNLLHH